MPRNEKKSNVAAVVVTYNRLEMLPGFSTDYSVRNAEMAPVQNLVQRHLGRVLFPPGGGVRSSQALAI